MTFVEPNGRWTDEGEFPDSNGAMIKPYDDVVLTRPIETKNPFNDDVVIAPAGAVGTVLMFNLGQPLVVDLEIKLEPVPFGIGFEELAKVTLHRRAEDKLRSKGVEA